jgi:GAF domain-containing protein
MRTLIIDKIDLRERFQKVNNLDQLRNLLQHRDIFKGLLRVAADAAEADDASVFLLNSEEEHLEVVLNASDRDDFVGFKQPLNQGIVSMVVWNEHAISIANVSENEMFDDTADRTFGYTTRSMTALPLVLQGHVIGVMTTVNKRNAQEFTDGDMSQLGAIATAITHTLRSQILDQLVKV